MVDSTWKARENFLWRQSFSNMKNKHLWIYSWRLWGTGNECRRSIGRGAGVVKKGGILFWERAAKTRSKPLAKPPVWLQHPGEAARQWKLGPRGSCVPSKSGIFPLSARGGSTNAHGDQSSSWVNEAGWMGLRWQRDPSSSQGQAAKSWDRVSTSFDYSKGDWRSRFLSEIWFLKVDSI